jgi:hypothetical protein
MLFLGGVKEEGKAVLLVSRVTLDTYNNGLF